MTFIIDRYFNEKAIQTTESIATNISSSLFTGFLNLICRIKQIFSNRVDSKKEQIPRPSAKMRKGPSSPPKDLDKERCSNSHITRSDQSEKIADLQTKKLAANKRLENAIQNQTKSFELVERLIQERLNAQPHVIAFLEKEIRESLDIAQELIEELGSLKGRDPDRKLLIEEDIAKLTTDREKLLARLKEEKALCRESISWSEIDTLWNAYERDKQKRDPSTVEMLIQERLRAQPHVIAFLEKEICEIQELIKKLENSEESDSPQKLATIEELNADREELREKLKKERSLCRESISQEEIDKLWKAYRKEQLEGDHSIAETLVQQRLLAQPRVIALLGKEIRESLDITQELIEELGSLQERDPDRKFLIEQDIAKLNTDREKLLARIKEEKAVCRESLSWKEINQLWGAYIEELQKKHQELSQAVQTLQKEKALPSQRISSSEEAIAPFPPSEAPSSSLGTSSPIYHFMHHEIKEAKLAAAASKTERRSSHSSFQGTSSSASS